MDFAWSEADREFETELCGFLDSALPAFRAQWAEVSLHDGPNADGPNVDGPNVDGLNVDGLNVDGLNVDGLNVDGLARGVMGAMEKRRAWQRRLQADRWAAILWPEAWGGRAATVSQHVIYTQTMARYRTPGIFNANGIVQIGPAIIEWGTDEQRARWLPGILEATDHWCQLFSEPHAGSDLAALRTTAILNETGDAYVLNGVKTWISSAQIAQWGMGLMRTDPTAIARGRQHDGITMFVIDMRTPGITISPIREITGEELFCEVVFDNVVVPVGDRLGDENAGWIVSMGALGKERVGSAGQAISMANDLQRLLLTAREVNPGALEDPFIRDRVARLHMQIEFTQGLIARALAKVLGGDQGWPEVPLSKLQWGEIALALAELALDVLGPEALLLKGVSGAIDDGLWARNYVWQRYTTIGAGPTEVQKNIIADRALRLER